jgi:PAS domain S-box-containing protein
MRELEIARQRLEDMSVQTDSWMWETDDNHVFSFFSQNVERQTGIEMSKLLGTSRLEMAQASPEVHWQNHAKDLINQHPFKDFRYIRTSPDGRLRNIVVTGWPVHDAQGNFTGYRGIGWDETRKVKQRESQVRKEEHLLNEIERQRANLDNVLQNLSQSVIWFDSEGHIKLTNARTLELLGFSKAEYGRVATIQQHLTLMAERGDFGEVDVEKEVAKRAKKLCVGITQATDYRIHLEHHDRYLDVSIRPLEDGSRILTHTDVTREANHAREVIERDAKMKEIIANIDYGVVLMDESLTVEFANRNFCETMGLDQSFIEKHPDMEEVFDKLKANKLFDFPKTTDKKWREYIAHRRHQISNGEQASVERTTTDGRTIVETNMPLASGKRMLTFSDITEMKLREQTLNTVINNVDQGILLMDADLKVEMANEKFREFWQLEPGFSDDVPGFSEILEKNRYNGLYPVDGHDEEAWNQYARERIDAVQKGDIASAELVRGDGRTFIFSAARLPGGRRMTTYFDVTADRSRQELFKLLVDNIDYATMVIDKDQNVELWNKKFRELMSIENTLLQEKPNLSRILDEMYKNACTGCFSKDPGEWASYRKEVLKAVAKGSIAPQERVRQDGKTVVHSCIELPEGKRLLTYFDVSDVKKMENEILAANRELADRLEELDKRQEIFNSLVDNIDYGAIILDENFVAELANKSFREMMNISEEFIAQKPSMSKILDAMHQNDCTGMLVGDDGEWQRYRDTALERYVGGAMEPVERLCRNGKTIMHSCIVLPDNKRLLTYLDISEHIEREQQLRVMRNDLASANEMLEDRVEQRTAELRKTQATLVQKERQALLGNLVASLCHELRNPLNALNTSMFIIRRKVEGDFPKLGKAFDRSERTIERCTNILNDLYEYALTSDIQLETIDIEQWIKAETTRVEIPKMFNVEFQIDPDLPTLDIDEKQMGSAIGKIISNAAQAVADHHDPTSRDPKIVISAKRAGDNIELAVTDNGPGMDEETLKSALEPLFSTRGFGVGLGLPIAEQTVKRHGGDIAIDSVKDHGTTVSLLLPVETGLEQAA